MDKTAEGWTSGFIGMVIFSGSLPATRAAVMGFDPIFLTAARAALAGAIGLSLLMILRQPRPAPRIALVALQADKARQRQVGHAAEPGAAAVLGLGHRNNLGHSLGPGGGRLLRKGQAIAHRQAQPQGQHGAGHHLPHPHDTALSGPARPAPPPEPFALPELASTRGL